MHTNILLVFEKRGHNAVVCTRTVDGLVWFLSGEQLQARLHGDVFFARNYLLDQARVYIFKNWCLRVEHVFHWLYFSKRVWLSIQFSVDFNDILVCTSKIISHIQIKYVREFFWFLVGFLHVKIVNIFVTLTFDRLMDWNVISHSVVTLYILVGSWLGLINFVLQVQRGACSLPLLTTDIISILDFVWMLFRNLKFTVTSVNIFFLCIFLRASSSYLLYLLLLIRCLDWFDIHFVKVVVVKLADDGVIFEWVPLGVVP